MIGNGTFPKSDLLVKEIRVSTENHYPAASHWQTLSHNAESLSGIRTHNISGVIINIIPNIKCPRIIIVIHFIPLG
jgi:hypothetical protein